MNEPNTSSNIDPINALICQICHAQNQIIIQVECNPLKGRGNRNFAFLSIILVTNKSGGGIARSWRKLAAVVRLVDRSGILTQIVK